MICCGLIEARAPGGFEVRVRPGFSAVICCGLIEADVDDIGIFRFRGFPQ